MIALPLKQSLPMGIIAALAASGVSMFFLFSLDTIGKILNVSVAMTTGLLAGTAAWWLIVARGRHFTFWRGAIAGAVAGVAGHPLFWYGTLLASWLYEVLTGGHAGIPGDYPMNPLEAIPSSMYLTLISLVVAGWMTVPVGALAGFLLVRHQRKAVDSSPS